MLIQSHMLDICVSYLGLQEEKNVTENVTSVLVERYIHIKICVTYICGYINNMDRLDKKKKVLLFL